MLKSASTNFLPFYEWLIIGGGIQGTAMAAALSRSGRWRRRDLAILDAHSEPLWAWHNRAANCGMYRLRSSVQFHLDCGPYVSPYSLTQWATTKDFEPQTEIYLLDSASKHWVASTRLFDAHCEWVVAEAGLREIWQQGVVKRLERLGEGEGGWLVHTDQGAVLAAKRVVLATGQEGLNYPQWAGAIPGTYHLLDLQATCPIWDNFGHITVVGGGLSSANFVLSLLSNLRPDQKRPHITILARHGFKVSLLETDLTATLSVDFQKQFQATDYVGRRQLIQGVRRNGTIPAVSFEAIQAASFDLRQTEVREVLSSAKPIRLGLSDGTELETEIVVLGTGFQRDKNPNKIIKQVAQDYAIPLSSCGYAMPASDLQWLPGLYLLGGAAELELGPVSRNIAGAGLGVRRIMQSLIAGSNNSF